MPHVDTLYLSSGLSGHFSVTGGLAVVVCVTTYLCTCVLGYLGKHLRFYSRKHVHFFAITRILFVYVLSQIKKKKSIRVIAIYPFGKYEPGH